VRSEPDVNVGDHVDGSIVAVMNYRFGNVKMLNTEPLPGGISGS
jgi:hypothetical protein